MNTSKKQILFLSFYGLIILNSCSDKAWKLQSENAVKKITADCKPSPQILKYSLWKIDFNKLKKLLTQNQNSAIIDLPDGNGNTISFKMFPSKTMSDELAKQFPELKSYMGNAVKDNSITIRANINETGFHAEISSVKGQWLIEPCCPGKSKNYYCCYSKADFKSNREPFNETR